MKELKKELKISPSLREQEKISYASDVINVPEGGIDCNEGCNPYGFPPALEEAMADFDIKRFGPYPHSHAIYDGLREYWKGYSDIEPENVLLADGSISALYVIFGLFQAPGAVVLGNAPTFSDAEMAARMLGMEWRAVALNPDRNYRFDPDAFVEQITDDVTMIYIDNPNNPTGQVINLYAIEKILDRALEVGAGVVIDEAYGDFMPNQNSAMTLTEEYPNLIMVRTMSKAFGLAGLRVGYIIAGKPIIRYMKKLRDPYMVSEFAREMAGKALMYPYHFWNNMLDFAKMKREIREALKKTGHLSMAETDDMVSIFVLYHDDPAVDLQKVFWENKVLCVSGADFAGMERNFVRIRLPKMEDFQILLEAVQRIHNGDSDKNKNPQG